MKLGTIDAVAWDSGPHCMYAMAPCIATDWHAAIQLSKQTGNGLHPS